MEIILFARIKLSINLEANLFLMCILRIMHKTGQTYLFTYIFNLIQKNSTEGSKRRKRRIPKSGCESKITASKERRNPGMIRSPKDYIEQIDVQNQINQPKELLTTGHFCVLLRQSARQYSEDYPLCTPLCACLIF